MTTTAEHPEPSIRPHDGSDLVPGNERRIVMHAYARDTMIVEKQRPLR
ncbi:hypothetical protein ABXS69_00975 [Actinomyces timonensis]|uniref:Uncharacterized protein n=1 Tax=Actinomyces timonensis TaxID=1288391 RepID=A0AAU8N2E1_9ACTO